MKTIRTAAERIFLGKNSGNLAERFQYHLLAIIPLLILTAACGPLQKVIELQAKSGRTVYAENWLAVASVVTGTAAIVLAGYVLILSLVLVIIGLRAKGEAANEGDTPA